MFRDRFWKYRKSMDSATINILHSLFLVSFEETNFSKHKDTWRLFIIKLRITKISHFSFASITFISETFDEQSLYVWYIDTIWNVVVLRENWQWVKNVRYTHPCSIISVHYLFRLISITSNCKKVLALMFWASAVTYFASRVTRMLWNFTDDHTQFIIYSACDFSVFQCTRTRKFLGWIYSNRR